MSWLLWGPTTCHHSQRVAKLQRRAQLFANARANISSTNLAMQYIALRDITKMLMVVEAG